jgi:DNA (cytosine-5)-methyltransferase 1
VNEPRHLDLFSGIGGFALAAKWAGFRTVAFVERDAYCQKVLEKNWPGVAIYGDICQFNGRSLTPISLLTGGFPCQPFSVAGERRGKADDRYLWPEMLRVIRATEPDWVIGENVAGLDGLGLDDCISDLEAIGYEVAPPLEIPACAVDARHVRNRIWILANSYSFRSRASGASRVESSAAASLTAAGEQSDLVAYATSELRNGTMRSRNGRIGPTDCGEDVANANKPRLQGRISGELQECSDERIAWTSDSRPGGPAAWPVEPNVGRVANGIPNRTHRLKGLGNAIVPQVAYQIIKTIYDQNYRQAQGPETDQPILAT